MRAHFLPGPYSNPNAPGLLQPEKPPFEPKKRGSPLGAPAGKRPNSPNVGFSPIKRILGADRFLGVCGGITVYFSGGTTKPGAPPEEFLCENPYPPRGGL